MVNKINKIYKEELISFRLDAISYDQLAEICNQEGASISEVSRAAVYFFLKIRYASKELEKAIVALVSEITRETLKIAREKERHGCVPTIDDFPKDYSSFERALLTWKPPLDS